MQSSGPERAGYLRRFWAFLIDFLIASVLAAAIWAPLSAAFGDPIRFEPFFLTPEADCIELGSSTSTDPEGREASTTDELCRLVYLERFTSYQRFQSKVTVEGGTAITHVTNYATNAEGRPVTVVTDGLAAMLLLLIVYVLLEPSVMRGSPGKWVLGLEVAGEAGGRLGFGQALARNLVKLAPFFILLAPGYWGMPLARLIGSDLTTALTAGSLASLALLLALLASAVATAERQTLYDLIAHSVVRRRI